ncbi:auxin-induced protein X15-like [Trifolium pratense]|uniref:auxin-induced protein X15-like n=1 Tax=Trifolium pratense TaxID=57577 RepID=UPI001E6924A4|nr:auxin-induced protein X15-like [Trifolium pratense]
MDFVKKCKRACGSSKKLYPEESSGSGSSYGKSSEKCHKKDISNKKPPNGYLCVYVGPERQRFVIKIKIFNHPLFKTLLEDVENEYGYTNDGPLWFPCDVELFCETLVEIESV